MMKRKSKPESNYTQEQHELHQQWDILRDRRTSYEPVWDELTELVLPSRGSYTYREVRTDPERRSQRRLESTAVYAARTLMARIIAEMTAPTTRWFELRDPDDVVDQDDAVRRTLQQLTDYALGILRNSSFALAHIEATMDWVVYGTAVMHISTDDEQQYPVFKTIPVTEIWCDEDKDGVVNLVFRKYKLTLRQMVQEFGLDNIPPEYQEMYETKPLEEVEIIHSISPNDDYEPNKKNKKYFRYCSHHFIPDRLFCLRADYFEYNPYIVFRFWKRPNEIYGGSPAIDALPDIRMLNAMEKFHATAVQLNVSPPILMAHDSVVMPLKIFPNAVNIGGYTNDGRRQVGNLFEGGVNVPALENYMERKIQQIRSAFFVDPLMNKENSIRTAAEVAKRNNEEMVGITPFLGRYENEYITPILDFVLQYLIKKKVVKIPPILAGRIPKIVFSAPLAKTQRAQELNNLLQFMQLLQTMAQAMPDILMNVDDNALFRQLADLLGVPMEVIKKPEIVSQLRAQAQQQQQMMQQAEMAMKAGELMNKMGGTLDQGLQGAATSFNDAAKVGLINRQDIGLPAADELV